MAALDERSVGAVRLATASPTGRTARPASIELGRAARGPPRRRLRAGRPPARGAPTSRHGVLGRRADRGRRRQPRSPPIPMQPPASIVATEPARRGSRPRASSRRRRGHPAHLGSGSVSRPRARVTERFRRTRVTAVGGPGRRRRCRRMTREAPRWTNSWIRTRARLRRRTRVPAGRRPARRLAIGLADRAGEACD